MVGNAKTFHLLIPTSASGLGVNTWCGGYQDTDWEGYFYNVVPGTSTINAVGNCDMYAFAYYNGITEVTWCTLTSITYS